MKRAIASIVLAVVVIFAKGQNLDSLIQLANKTQGKVKIDYLLEITWELRNKNPAEGIKYAIEAIRLADSLKEYYELAKAYSFLGVLYRNLGYYGLAFSYYKRGLTIAQKHNFLDQLAYSYNNIGNIYLYQNLPHKAIEHLVKADSIGKLLNNADIRAYALQNIGRAYLLLNKPDSAIIYFQKAYQLRKSANLIEKLPITLKYLADAYKLKGDYQKALYYYRLTQKYADFNRDYDLYADFRYQQADLYLKMQKIDSAIYFAKVAVAAAKAANTPFRLMNAYYILAQAYAAQKQYDSAFYYLNQAFIIKDKLFNEEVIKNIQGLELTEEALKKENAIKLLQKDLKIKQLQIKRQKIIIFSGLSAFITILTFSIILFYSYRKIKKLSKELQRTNAIIKQQNEELKRQKELLEKQYQELKIAKHHLEVKDKIITDSLNYAKLIITTLMDTEIDLSRCPFIKDYFILNKPKEIVGGDFYLFKSIDKSRMVLIVGDGTGHGVSGAIMSVLSISLLQNILNQYHNLSAAKILEIFRIRIKAVLKQNKSTNLVKDGADLAVVMLDKENQVFEFSGAYSSIFIVRNNTLVHLKGTKSTAGFSIKELPFMNQRFNLNEISKIYMFTDGIIDQFGGAQEFKFTTKRFFELIDNIKHLPMDEQKTIIEETFEQWNDDREQIDDVLVVGIELKK